MKVLLYGMGWIGSQVLEILHNENIVTHIGQARVENIEDVEHEILDIKPTHVMSFIGRTHGTIDGKIYTTIDYLEQDGKIKDNVRDN